MSAPQPNAHTAPTSETGFFDMTAIERATAYQWLSGIFARELPVETLNAYRSEDGQALLEGLKEVPQLAPVVGEILVWVTDAPESDLSVVSMDIASDYARLFLGVAGRRSAPPYQSFYSNEQGRLMQQSASDMQNQMRKADVRLADDFSELPDHLAVQLAVMAQLVETASPKEQAEYLKSHLLDWVGEFAERCEATTPAGFYAVAAAAVFNFVQADADYLSN